MMNQQYIAMGNRIKTRRKELHINQNQLAERLDISNNHMSSIETGKEKPSLDVFTQICIELDVTPNYLLLGSMHSDNTLQNVVDKLRLCSAEDIRLVNCVIEHLIQRRNENV